MKRVAVIGAGAAGLAAMRHLTARPKLYTPVAYEQSANIGGTWVYTDETGLDINGQPIFSSMYKNLKTNLPKEVMQYIGFPFPKHLPSFCRHDDVRRYLEDFADHFRLRDYIQFNKIVTQVTPLKQEDGHVSWNVTVRDTDDLKAENARSEIFDAVFVGVGHYSLPLIPDIPGAENFKGLIMHSHDYREPEVFSGRRVCCLGAAASGQDIALEIAAAAKEVIISHNKPRLLSPLPSNVRQAQGVRSLTQNSAIMKDDEEYEIDVLLLCTGYRYSFPFLSPECHVNVDTQDERVTPLYKHIIHTEFPTLAFIGICKTVLPFPQFECQVKFVLSAWEGTYPLPSEEEMNADIQADFDWRLSVGMPGRYAHHLGKLQWAYNDDLADRGKFPRIDPLVHQLYDAVHETRTHSLMVYKKFNYQCTDSEYVPVEQ